jgi:hypothetical protein
MVMALTTSPERISPRRTTAVPEDVLGAFFAVISYPEKPPRKTIQKKHLEKSSRHKKTGRSRFFYGACRLTPPVP